MESAAGLCEEVAGDALAYGLSVENQLGGYDRSELETDFATAMALFHPDDLERAERAMRAYLSGQTKEYEAEGRFRQ